MTANKFRPGTNQNDRFKAALQPEYISVEERSTLDLLRYLKDYAKTVRFYDTNNSANGFWSSFLNLVEESEREGLTNQEIVELEENRLKELANFAENPAEYNDDLVKLEKFSQPHLTLLLGFLNLLKHPKAQFASLTRKHLEYFYRDILNLEEQSEIPDQVHVVFQLAQDVSESLIKEGLLLNAGKDATGVDLQYEVTENLVLNQAAVADVKTIHFVKSTSDLNSVHLEYDRGDEGFEKILCLVLDRLTLPTYINDYGIEIETDAAFLRTELYGRIKEKKRDDLAPNDATYIFEQLCFPYLKDFWTCVNALYRENNRGYVGITIPEETEWEEVYDILENVHKERLARTRRNELKQTHKVQGFEALMEYAFGEPNPGNLLFAMPGSISTLDELAVSETEAARKYVESQLCMTVDDFRVVMQKRDRSLGEIVGDEVYEILESAWTKKREYQYPSINAEYVEGYYADTVFSSNEDDSIQRFVAFGKSSNATDSQNIEMGFAVGSPLLLLNEGQRNVDLFISAQEESLNYDEISELLSNNNDLFNIYLSTQSGWQQALQTEVEIGKFIIKQPLKSYNEKYSYLVCDTVKFNILNETSIGWYILFNNGLVYRIEKYDYLNNRILLASVYLNLSTDTTQLITALTPRTFVDPLNGILDIERYVHVVTHTEETFSNYHEDKYLVDNKGSVFFIKQFIAADTVEVRYCGAVSDNHQTDPLIINRIWETIEPEFADFQDYSDISDLTISEIYSDDREFRFEINESKLRIEYPIDPTNALSANDLMLAWEDWNDNPEHNKGRFEISRPGNGSWRISPFTKQIELTGETIKRYESLDEKGIRVTYRGRPLDQVFLEINERSSEYETSQFLVAGGVLTITPGLNSFTSNQVAADWQLWIEENNPQGFQIESKDKHEWEAIPVVNLDMPKVDKQVKYLELRNPYGNGIRVTYTGPGSHQPRLLLKENEIDLFEFEIVKERQLIIKYPSVSINSANDLVQEWDAWRISELNDQGNFEIKQLGDGLWEIEGKREAEFHAINNQIIECIIQDYNDDDEIIHDIGVVAMYRLSEEYRNAIIELKENPAAVDFVFEFEDVDDADLLAKKLTITYPPLTIINDDPDIQKDYQISHVQKLLSKWNRLTKKYNFFLIKKEDDATWPTDPLPQLYSKNFLDDLAYICNVHPDGFKARYQPNTAGNTILEASIVIEENQEDVFDFQLKNSYAENLKILFIRFPKDKTKRTIDELLTAWEIKPVNTDFNEFTLEKTGTGKWIINSEMDVPLITETSSTTPIDDEIRRQFYAYKTNDVYGFEITYSGPDIAVPDINLIENSTDDFEVSVTSFLDDFYNVTVEDSLTIKYPKLKSKRKLVELFKVWNNWKSSTKNLNLGFEIVDTTGEISERAKAPLLDTGDRIREFKVGDNNGLCFTYTGHRDLVELELSAIVDFSETDVGKKIVWDNGEIFSVKQLFNNNSVIVEPVDSIQQYDSILQYDSNAICLNSLKFSARIDPDFPPVVSDPANAMSSHPMMRVLFNNQKEFDQKSSEAVYYEAFNSILMDRVDLKVDVNDLKQVKARSNISMINPDNPFHPFGTAPDKSARFYFANREICEKKLDSFKINLSWKNSDYMNSNGLPDMEAHYYAYSHSGLKKIPTINNGDFEIDLQFKDQRSWISIANNTFGLFNHSISCSDFDKQTYQGNLFEDDEDLPKDPLDWQRYYRLELLDQGFLSEFVEDVSQTLAEASNRMLIAENEYNIIKQEIESRDASIRSAKKTEAEARVKGDTYIPQVIPEARSLPSLPENDKDLTKLEFNDPYSPYIESISFDYSATSSVAFTNSSDVEEEEEVPVGLFRYHPFGFSEVGQYGIDDEDDYLLPHYSMQGYLNIGIQNIKPTQTLSLLVQMVSGSGDALLSIPDITWSYLSSNKWLPFNESQILKDTTYGLQDTGIVRLSIPEDATLNNTVMPSDRCWIRAEAENNISAVPDIIDIQPQALLAYYKNQNNDPDHLSSPLLAETISELVERDSAIKEVRQPYSSFKGKRKEAASEFYARISERLKHKQRALTLKDYENLILSKFSEIYKAKCLPQGELKLLNNNSEGEVVIVVILKNRNATPFFPLKPKTPANILRDIEQFITSYMPPLVSVKIVNPRFEEVQYRLAVKFTENHDFGFYINQLNEDIKQFLSPWAYDKNAEISFGSTVYSSSAINYIENVDYVDYIANFTLLKQTIKHEEYTEVIPLFLTEDNVATTLYPDSILVSAEEHIIDVIHTDLYDDSSFRGIGHMIIDTDFWINRPGSVFSVGIGEMEIEKWPVSRYIFHIIELTVNVTGTVDGVEENKDFTTMFSREDSQKIWDLLKDAEYIDAGGNVLHKTRPYEVDFHIEFNDQLFVEYLKGHLADFDFGLNLTASDFVEDPEEDVSFSYEFNAIYYKENEPLAYIEQDIIDLLTTAMGFTGLSQFPFIVY